MKPEYEDLPYRPGVGLVILNHQNDIFIGERFDQPGIWQLPQGGIDDGDEDFNTSVFRELYEETGIRDATILKIMDDWQYYDLPDHLIARLWDSKYRGQKQKWVALRHNGQENEINLHTSRYPEFRSWQWISRQEMMKKVIAVKRATYEIVFDDFKDLF